MSDFFKLPLFFAYDKLIFLLNSRKEMNERGSMEMIERYARNKTFPIKRINDIWNDFFTSNHIHENTIKSVYCLKSTIHLEWTFKRILFYIQSKFWSLLDFFDVDTWGWKDEDVFDRPSLKVYSILTQEENIILVIASFRNQKISLLESFELKSLPLDRFKNRQLVYIEGGGGLSV